MTTAHVRRAPTRDFEYEVLDLLESHGAREGTLLDSYRQVLEESSTGDAVRYLVRLILEDEERHHRVFTEMANYIKSFVWEVEVEPKVPAMAPRSDPRLSPRPGACSPSRSRTQNNSASSARSSGAAQSRGCTPYSST